MAWHSKAYRKPAGWNPIAQLRAAQLLGTDEYKAMLFANILTVSETSLANTTVGRPRSKKFAIVRPTQSSESTTVNQISVINPSSLTFSAA
jgi:hypothetical protein